MNGEGTIYYTPRGAEREGWGGEGEGSGGGDGTGGRDRLWGVRKVVGEGERQWGVGKVVGSVEDSGEAMGRGESDEKP